MVRELREKVSETDTKLQALTKTTKDGIARVTTDVSNLETETSKGISVWFSNLDMAGSIDRSIDPDSNETGFV